MNMVQQPVRVCVCVCVCSQVLVDMVQQPAGLSSDMVECAVAALRNLCVNCPDNQARPFIYSYILYI